MQLQLDFFSWNEVYKQIFLKVVSSYLFIPAKEKFSLVPQPLKYQYKFDEMIDDSVLYTFYCYLFFEIRLKSENDSSFSVWYRVNFVDHLFLLYSILKISCLEKYIQIFKPIYLYLVEINLADYFNIINKFSSYYFSIDYTFDILNLILNLIELQ